MPHIGSLGGFPGDWSYQGNAELLLKDTVQLVPVSLRFTFREQSEIDVEIIWDSFSRDEQVQIALKMDNEKMQQLVIQKSILLLGFSIPPFDVNRTTEFNVVKLITYSQFPTASSIEEDTESIIQLKAYLNDSVSLDDGIFAREFENMSQMYSKKFNDQKDSLYCALNSGYEVRCGKKYITHKDQQTIHFTKNIETLYKFSFIDVIVSSINENISNLIVDEPKNIEIFLAKHLECIFNDVCAFLSIVCDREILPIYYDYSIYNQNKHISGRVIPIWSRRKILKVNKYWITREINFMSNVTAFLECCPISKQLSRGIQHLRLTVYESSAELKLMASCSAIEYFYSFWLLKMNGISKLINIDPIQFKRLKDFKPNDRTPPLSTVIRHVADELSIDWNKYMKKLGKPEFLEVRNELLHGSFTSDDIAIFQAEEKAQKLGTEILFAIMKRISKSKDSHLYETLPARTPEENFYSLSDGWHEVKNILDN
ncbi:MAG: hypothetical protein M1G31_10570 [Pseudanabaena sp. Salubria-1]|nr:hypothetical protein [Pseudanabaena sp. Salubria-1]